MTMMTFRWHRTNDQMVLQRSPMSEARTTFLLGNSFLQHWLPEGCSLSQQQHPQWRCKKVPEGGSLLQHHLPKGFSLSQQQALQPSQCWNTVTLQERKSHYRNASRKEINESQNQVEKDPPIFLVNLQIIRNKSDITQLWQKENLGRRIGPECNCCTICITGQHLFLFSTDAIETRNQVCLKEENYDCQKRGL